MKFITYVTYDADGNLTDYYIQELLPEHAGSYIQLPEDSPCTSMNFFYYQANETRDGVELIPV